MDAYVYQAALICPSCAREVNDRLMDRNPDDHYDSTDWLPEGPYANGGGEADSPQCCDICFCDLDNPLTLDAYNELHAHD